MKLKLTKRTIAELEPGEKAFEVNDSELPGFLLRIQPTGHMTYYARFRLDDGTRGRVRVGPARILTPVQARDKARDLLAQATQGIDPSEARRSARSHTLGTFIDDIYAPWASANRKDGANACKRIKSSFRELLKQRLKDLNSFQVERWRNRRLKAKSMKIATINRNIAMLKAALSKAVEWNLLDEHPLRRVKLLREDSRAKVRYLSDDEDQRLYDALDAREKRLREKRDSANAWRQERGYDLLPDLRNWAYADHLKPMIVLSLNLGVRRGELFNLTWADIDLRTRNIHIAGEGTKSGLTRHIPLNDTAHACLRDWKKQTRGSGLVFVNQHGHRFDHCNTAWRGVLAEVGIKAYRWHDMRHTFASRLVVEGVDLNTVRELLGHSDLSMTLRYAHLAPHVKQDAVDTLTRNRGAAMFPSSARKKA